MVFVKDRFVLNATWYQNKTENQLLSYTLPLSHSDFRVSIKIFQLWFKNYGVELSLNTTNLRTKNLRWESNFNLTIPKNKLLKFPNLGSTSYASRLAIGEPITITKVFRFIDVKAETGIYQFEVDMAAQLRLQNISTDRNVLIDTDPRYVWRTATIDFNLWNFQLDFLQFPI